MNRNVGFLVMLLMAAPPMAGAQQQPFFIGGSFSGIAQAEQLPLGFPPPHPESYYDGAPITGSFEVFVPNPQPQSPGSGYFLNTDGWLSLSYTIKNETFSFFVGSPDPSSGSLPSVILLQASSASSPVQSVSFLTDFVPKYDGASFQLTGPPGSLFDGLDANTLRFDPSHPPLFGTSFASASAEMQFSIDVTQVSFRTLAPVPEPATTALLLAGVALLGARRFIAATGFFSGPSARMSGKGPRAQPGPQRSG